MNEFKKGDKVVYIDNKRVTNYLDIGKVYTVISSYTSVITIQNGENIQHEFFIDRFRLATLLEKELSE